MLLVYVDKLHKTIPIYFHLSSNTKGRKASPWGQSWLFVVVEVKIFNYFFPPLFSFLCPFHCDRTVAFTGPCSVNYSQRQVSSIIAREPRSALSSSELLERSGTQFYWCFFFFSSCFSSYQRNKVKPYHSLAFRARDYLFQPCPSSSCINKFHLRACFFNRIAQHSISA